MNIRRLFFTLCFCAAQLLLGEAQETDGLQWLYQNRGWLDLQYKVAGISENPLLARITFGTFSLGMDFGIVRGSRWEMRTAFEVQNLFGGFRDRHAKIYAGAYLINLHSRIWITPSQLYLFLGTIHLSTHRMDSLGIETPEDLARLEQINIDIEDVNVFRFGLGRETPDDHWAVGVQPWRMNYWLFTEPKYFFKHGAYSPYDRRGYLLLTRTLWRDDTHRISAALNAEFDRWSEKAYMVRLTYATRLGITQSLDHIQLSLGYEGGLEPNEVRARSFAGIAMNRVVLGARIIFGDY